MGPGSSGLRAAFGMVKFLSLAFGILLAVTVAFGKPGESAAPLAGLACFCALVSRLAQVEELARWDATRAGATTRRESAARTHSLR